MKQLCKLLCQSVCPLPPSQTSFSSPPPSQTIFSSSILEEFLFLLLHFRRGSAEDGDSFGLSRDPLRARRKWRRLGIGAPLAHQRRRTRLSRGAVSFHFQRRDDRRRRHASLLVRIQMIMTQSAMTKRTPSSLLFGWDCNANDIHSVRRNSRCHQHVCFSDMANDIDCPVSTMTTDPINTFFLMKMRMILTHSPRTTDAITTFDLEML